MYKNNQGKILRAGRRGFSLLELLVVVTILALGAVIATSVFSDKANQTRFERTVESMEEIRKAILGVTSDRVRGDVRFAGYVQDVGALPELIDENRQVVSSGGQPKGLWTNDPMGTPGNTDDDLVPDPGTGYAFGIYCRSNMPDRGHYYGFIRIGWRGPYVTQCLDRGALLDGWRNPFVFSVNDKDFEIKSLGADGKEDGEEGAEGYDRDIVRVIRKRDYMGVVSGYVGPQTVVLEDQQERPITVRIYYTPIAPVLPACEEIQGEVGVQHGGNVAIPCSYYKIKDCLSYMEMPIKADGYFRFQGVPVGTQRVLEVRQSGTSSYTIEYKIAVEQGDMWLGTLGKAP